MAIHKWKLVNPTNLADEWVFPINPTSMTSPFPERSIEVGSTSGQDGQAIYYERPLGAWEFGFSGSILSRAQHDDMKLWFYDRNGFYLYEHFGRRFDCKPKAFLPTPMTKVGKYWYSRYEAKVLVLRMPTEPVVGDIWG